jgi:Secretion system C-terminal sorting domain
MKLGHLTCILLPIVFIFPNITAVNAQNQQMYIRTDAVVAHKEDKTAPARRTTSTLSDNQPPITNIQKDSVKMGASTPISVSVSTPQRIQTPKKSLNEAPLMGFTTTHWVVANLNPNIILQVSPNPVIDAAVVTLVYEGLPIQANCYLTDMTGKVVWQKQLQIVDKTTLEALIINELPKGLYLMRVQIGTTFLIQKVMKM